MPTISSYRVFGLNVRCDWPLFQLQEAVFSDIETDVSIITASIEFDKFAFSQNSDLFQVDGINILLTVPDVALFLICTDSVGTKVTVHICDKADIQTVNLYMLGSVFGTILHQRGILPLHGNCINIHGKAVLAVARSGVGKSTLASEFFLRHYSMLADDVCAVDLEGFVHPSYPYLKLWHEAIARLNPQPRETIKITAQKEKYYVPIGDQFHSSKLPLRSIYIMTRDSSIDRVEIDKAKGAKKLTTLKPHIYRLQYLRKLGKEKPGMKRMIERLSNIDIFHVRRPFTGMHVEEIADKIIDNEDASKQQLDSDSVALV